jgi:glutamate/tyrosine decarboxylase-like PLP-dependent enzyme
VVVEELAEAADPGVVATVGGRYFGFVIGGTLPAARAADWLVSTWDQSGPSPAVRAIENITARWALELLGLPTDATVGFVTGAQAASTTGLAAARHRVLERLDYDVAGDGLAGAPRVRVIVGGEAHVTILRAIRLLGFGDRNVEVMPIDDQGRMDPAALEEALDGESGPAIVCAQAGNVNSGAVDDLDRIANACERAGAWLHIDGAFGMWAATSPALRGLVRGAERADSWAIDAHKWLQVPYDGALAIVAHPAAHRAAMDSRAPYLAGGQANREGILTPELSRRARAIPIYAALRSLGRRGVAELVERCCGHARAMASGLAAEPGVEVLNDVVLNQVLVRFGDDDAVTEAVVAEVQRDGTCWLGPTVWRDRAAMRISVCNWATTDEDAARSVDAILAAAARIGALLRSP